MGPDPSDAALLEAVAAQDLGALRALYDRHFAWLSVRLARRCNDPDLAVWLRLFAPFALFISSGSNGAVVQTWRGSVGWFVGWQVALCLLAVAVALLHDASPLQRRWLRRALGVIVVCGLIFLALAATGGLSHALAVDPSGHVVQV